MQIKIKGENKKISLKELRFATKWMSSLIMSSQLLKGLQLTITFKSEKGLAGSTEITDYENRLPKEFIIRLDPTEHRTQTLRTLAHELVHVKQFARGEMVELIRTNYTKWNKQYIKESKFDYFDLPWEIEAFGREYGMYRRYIDHIKDKRIKFE